MSCKVIALLGTYRKGDVIDKTVDEILALAAKEAGAFAFMTLWAFNHIRFSELGAGNARA